jgi:NAD dependent epimerase/dehydratase family enzyme
MPAGREMDRLIAEKVMNWYVSPSGMVDRQHKPGDIFLNDVCETWEPSTNIAAAWEVAEKLKIVVIPLSDNKGWAAQADEEFDPDLGWYERPVEEWVNAETAPLAICRAALIEITENA